jgi:HAD superfamily hydrolase (TIGR01484 family)
MTKKVIAFDLDDTLAVTKSPISNRMSEILTKLLDLYDVCVISGGKFDQFKKQIIDCLPNATPEQLYRLHIMPTCGTRYYRFDITSGEWIQKYAEDLTEEEKAKIIGTLELSAKEVGLWVSNPYGEIIEDRGSQITYSALGQQAPAEEKYNWARENDENKKNLQRIVSSRLPDLEVRLGGTTSVDVTRKGIDKAYGMKKLTEELQISKENVLYIGDKLQEGGNDFPVRNMGIDTIEVRNAEDTIFILEGILAVAC